MVISLPPKVFQVVPPCGGHRGWIGSAKWPESFKSCPRVGGILLGAELRRVGPGFKSCPRVGGIRVPSIPVAMPSVSSRAPVWGASRRIRRRLTFALVSSRAPVWGASRRPVWPRRWGCFKSCPRVGGIRGSIHLFYPLDRGFKSCPRVGGIPRGIKL